MTSRIDIIGTNGNDGQHYEDQQKVRFTCGHNKACPPGSAINYVCEVPGCNGTALIGVAEVIPDAGAKPTMADLYPKYYKDVSNLQSVDVYRVHRLFGVTDNEIHHASKKLLLCGVRTGGKPARKEVEEARDTLNRWLEIQDEDEQA